MTNNTNLEKKPYIIDIDGVTLLTTSEAKRIAKKYRNIGKPWWLRSKGDDTGFVNAVNDPAFVATVNDHGDVLNHSFDAYNYYYGGSDESNVFACNWFGVRPALKFTNRSISNLQTGDHFEIADHMWTVVAKNLALCDEIIKTCKFDMKTNDYDQSYIKNWLTKWAVKNHLLPTERTE